MLYRMCQILVSHIRGQDGFFGMYRGLYWNLAHTVSSSSAQKAASDVNIICPAEKLKHAYRYLWSKNIFAFLGFSSLQTDRQAQRFCAGIASHADKGDRMIVFEMIKICDISYLIWYYFRRLSHLQKFLSLYLLRTLFMVTRSIYYACVILQ